MAVRIMSGARVASIMLVAGTLALGCSSSDDPPGDPSGPSATRISTLALGAQRVRGSGEMLAVWGQPSYWSVALRILQQDTTDPDHLLDVATIVPPATGGFDKADFSINSQWITVAGGFQASFVQFVRTAGPYGQAGTLPLAAAERAAGWNDRLVAVSPTTLWVYDIATPSSPVLRATFTPTSRSTAIAAVGGGVFVFNMTGYGYVDVAADTYVETASTNLKGITSATAYGGKLHVGGPSRYAGYFRVARLDPGTAPSLTVDVQNELIADGDVSGANIADSAFDPVTEEYVVLAETERSDPYGPPTSGSSTILRYAEEGGRIVPRGAARLDHVACTTQNCMYSGSDGTGRIHAYGGRVYAVLVQGANEPLYAYRLP